MNDARLDTILAIIQEDVGQRGLRKDPQDNLITACPHDFHDACQSLAEAPKPAVGIITGFLIPHAEPPAGETDGPLGALLFARVLVSLGARVMVITENYCAGALAIGLEQCGLRFEVPVVTLPPATHHWSAFLKDDWEQGILRAFPLTHYLSLERVGPSHTIESLRAQRLAISADQDRFLREVPQAHRDRCHNMRGHDITARTAPAHLLIEAAQACGIKTIGIGDGGNEIGMGKIRWNTIRRNIPSGGLIACRVPTDQLIVAGVSNWGAYGLAAGVSLLKRGRIDRDLFDPERERELLQIMVERGPLVDGVTAQPTVTVDGLDFERYIEPLRAIRGLA